MKQNLAEICETLLDTYFKIVNHNLAAQNLETYLRRCHLQVPARYSDLRSHCSLDLCMRRSCEMWLYARSRIKAKKRDEILCGKHMQKRRPAVSPGETW